MFQSKACRDRLCATSRAGHFLAPKTNSFLGTKKERKIEYLRYSSMRVLCHLCGVSYLYCLPSPVLSGRSPVVLSPVSSVLLTSTLVLSPLCCIPPTYVSRLCSGVSCPPPCPVLAPLFPGSLPVPCCSVLPYPVVLAAHASCHEVLCQNLFLRKHSGSRGTSAQTSISRSNIFELSRVQDGRRA